MVVFGCASAFAFAVLRYRAGQCGLHTALFEQAKWTVSFGPRLVSYSQRHADSRFANSSAVQHREQPETRPATTNKN
jgi:hypothetical protein